MSKKITGWQIIKTTGISGPKSGHQTVYEHKDAAQFKLAEAQENAGEWDSHELVECKYEMLNDTKCEVDGRVACVNRTTRKDYVAMRAIHKLTKEERASLHLPDADTLKAIQELHQAWGRVQSSMDGFVQVTTESVSKAKSVFQAILGK